MTVRSRYDREIFRLAVPALGSLAAEPLYILVDTAIVGHLGRSHLAALGIAATVLGGLFAIFNFLCGSPRSACRSRSSRSAARGICGGSPTCGRRC